MTWVERAAKSFYDSVTQVLSHKSIDFGSNTVTMTKAQLNAALSDADVATLTGNVLTGIREIDDTNGHISLDLPATTSAVNYMQVNNSPTGQAPGFTALGADGDISMIFVPKGSGQVAFWANSQSQLLFAVAGGNADVDMNVVTQGAGRLKENGNIVATRVAVPSTASSTGRVGQYACDSSFRYDCIATNTWVRSAAATW